MRQTSISNNIRKLRFYHDEMTQKELADRVGVTRQTIVAIEKAQYSPSLEVAFRIARVFGTPLEEIFIYSPEEDQALVKRARRPGANHAGKENQGSCGLAPCRFPQPGTRSLPRRHNSRQSESCRPMTNGCFAANACRPSAVLAL